MLKSDKIIKRQNNTRFSLRERLALSKGSSKFYFILLGMGIGLIFSGIYFFINPQIEYREKNFTDDEILEMAAVIKLEAAKEKNKDDESTGDNTDTEDNDENEENNETSGISDNNPDESDNESGQAQEDTEEEQVEESNEEPSEEPNEEPNEEEEEQGDEANQQTENDNDANDTKDNTDNNDVTDENVDDEKQDEYVTVKIEKGDLSEIIARKLYDAGVIDDAEAFHKFIKDNSAEENLDYGLLELKKGTDYETLLELLTVN